MNHLALILLLPAAILAWRWSRHASAALALTLLAGIAFLLVPHEAWTFRDGEWRWTFAEGAYRMVLPGLVGLAGAFVLFWRHDMREMCRHCRVSTPEDAALVAHYALGRPDALAALLVVSMGVDLAALLLHRGTGQWGPQPFFQCATLLAVCAISAYPRRK
jgi:hypothetical protein